MSNRNDIDIYFADPGAPSRRGLNEHSNGLLRKDGLPKHMDFNAVDQGMVASAASRRNHIPRESLNYQTPLEVFMSYMSVAQLFSLFDKRSDVKYTKKQPIKESFFKSVNSIGYI